MEEKRSHDRKTLSAEVLVAHHATGEPIEAVLLNISNYGACLNTSVYLKTSDKVRFALKVNTPESKIESEELLCTVRWVERNNGIYTTGLSFDMKVKPDTYPLFIACLEYTQVRR